MTLRTLIDSGDFIVAPGAYDGLTARLIEQAGFPVVYMTGAGTAAVRGYPDYGLLTMTEMAANAAVIARSVGVPVLADADTGYGNELNVTRTVREYEAAGVAGIHLEDQVAPKRCGHLDGKEVVDLDHYVSLIRAAVGARSSHEFVIVARTDAVAVTGLDDAIDRANAALDAGADVAFVEAVTTLEDAARVPAQVRGPCLLNIVGGGLTPVRELAVAEAMGYRIVLLPTLLLASAVATAEAVLGELHATGVLPATAELPVTELFRRLGAADWDRLRKNQ